MESLPRILGVLQQKELLIDRNVSCTGNMLKLGLGGRGALVDIVDVEVYGLPRHLMVALNFWPRLETWRFRFHLDSRMRQLRSARAKSMFGDYRGKVDAVVQIGSEFDLSQAGGLKGLPRFSYHDSNLHAYLRGAWNLPKAPGHVRTALAYEKAVYDRLTGVLTMTEYLRDVFVSDFQIPESKVHCVGVGLNFGDVPELRRSDDGRTLLFVARHLFEQKGGLVVLEAFRRVRREVPDARLLMVGQHLGITEPGVESIGFIDKSSPAGAAKMSALYAAATVFVLPSYYDALGNVFIEAMAHGVPCIGADCCAMPEIIVGNSAGFVVPPGDADALARHLVALLKDDGLRSALGANGRNAVVAKYNWSVVGENVLDVISRHL